MIDKKFIFIAVNPCNGHIYTEEDALILCAKDECTIDAMVAYHQACIDKNCGANQIESARLLLERVKTYQKDVTSKIPDVVGDCEIELTGGSIDTYDYTKESDFIISESCSFLNGDPDKITLQSNIEDDLIADSLDRVELVMTFEEAFNCNSIPDEIAEAWITLEDVLTYVKINKLRL